MGLQQPEPSPAEDTRHSAKRFGPVSAVLVTLGAFFGSQLLAALVIGLVIALTGKNTSETAQTLTESTFGRFMFVLVVEVLTLGILFWFIRRRGIKLNEIGLGRLPKSSDTGYALVSFGIYFVLLAIIMYCIGEYIPGINLEQEQQIGFESATGAAALGLVFISLVILPPIVEEIMIRGFLYSGLRHKLGRFVSAIVASAIFGVAHLQLGAGAPPLYVAAIDTFVLSMVLIALRERTGSLWAGILVHALKNGLAFTALFIFNVS